MNFWRAVRETVELCRLGIKKESKERTTAKELDCNIGGSVELGLGRKRRCTCEVAKDTDARNNSGDSAELSSKYALDHPSFGRHPNRPDWLPSSELTSLKSSESPPRSVDAAKQRTVWGLGDLATLHENMMPPASVMSSDDRTAWELGHEPDTNRYSKQTASILSGKESTVWGLGDAQREGEEEEEEDDDDQHTIGRRKSVTSATDSCIAIGEMEVLEGYGIEVDDNDDDDDGSYEDVLYGKKNDPEHWPLPPQTLALDRGKAREMDGHRDLRRIGAMG